MVDKGLLQSMGIFVGRINNRSEVQPVTENWTEISQWPIEELIDRPFSHFLTRAQSIQLSTSLAQLELDGDHQTLHLSIQGGDGKVIPLKTSLFRHNKINYLSLIASTSKNQSEELKEMDSAVNLKQQLEALSALHPDAVVITDHRRVITNVNTRFTELFGYTKEEIIGQGTDIMYFNSSDYKSQGQERFNIREDAKNDWTPYRMIYRTKEGAPFEGQTSGGRVFDEFGDPIALIGTIGIVDPIIEQKKELAKLCTSATSLFKASNEINQSLIENAPITHSEIERYLGIAKEAFDLSIGILSSIEGGIYTVEAVHADSEGIETGMTFSVEDSYCYYVVTQKSTLAFHHVGSEPLMCDHPVYLNMKLESYISAPIFNDGQVVGTINFSSTRIKKEPFTQLEIDFVNTLAKLASRYLKSIRQKEA